MWTKIRRSCRNNPLLYALYAYHACYNDTCKVDRKLECWVARRNTSHGDGKTKAACLKSLKDLQLEYLDLYLVRSLFFGTTEYRNLCTKLHCLIQSHIIQTILDFYACTLFTAADPLAGDRISRALSAASHPRDMAGNGKPCG